MDVVEPRVPILDEPPSVLIADGFRIITIRFGPLQIRGWRDGVGRRSHRGAYGSSDASGPAAYGQRLRFATYRKD